MHKISAAQTKHIRRAEVNNLYISILQPISMLLLKFGDLQPHLYALKNMHVKQLFV